MREILFRGKRKDNGEWVCSGNLIHFNEDNEYYIPNVNSKCTCTHDEDDNIVEWDKVMFCKVIPETVGQYTGLIDKNGKKIFEGDIVRAQDNLITSPFCDGIIGKIVYDECAFFIEPENPMDTQWLFNECAEYEVIGNIHDNPELLEEMGCGGMNDNNILTCAIEHITTEDFGKCLGYSEKPCVNCGRLRVERYENGKEICEKCRWEQTKGGYIFDE